LTENWRKQHPDIEPASKLLERILAERRAKWKGKRKYREPVAPDTNNLPPLPRGWMWATVEQLASGLPGSIQSGPFGSQLLHSEFVDEGVLAIGIDNVLDGRFSLGKQHRITAEKFEVLRKFEARPRDVLITVMATVGRVCVLPQNFERAIVTKHCYRITPTGEAVDSDYQSQSGRPNAPAYLQKCPRSNTPRNKRSHFKSFTCSSAASNRTAVHRRRSRAPPVCHRRTRSHRRS
jgi:type I restriction enzyme S subunit